MTDIPRATITASDDEIEAAFSDLGYSLTVEDLCFGPGDELAHIKAARANWTDPGQLETDEPDVLVIERAQALRGQRRRDVVVIRLGDYVAIYGADK